MHIYKLVFDTEQQSKQVLIDNNVWEEVTYEGVTTLRYINGTKGVVYIGKVIKTQGTYDQDGHEITPPIYYDSVAYDVMSTDELELEQYRVYPNGTAAHQFYGYKRDDET